MNVLIATYKVYLHIRKFEKLMFLYIFLDQDISLDISLIHFKVGVHKDSTYMQGTVCQISYLGLSFLYMESRKIICKKLQKVSHFPL